jgi:hypothetical protein
VKVQEGVACFVGGLVIVVVVVAAAVAAAVVVVFVVMMEEEGEEEVEAGGCKAGSDGREGNDDGDGPFSVLCACVYV